MRVVSLVPAATEIVYAIGAIDELVAVTHDDDYPPTVRVLPSVTRTTIPHDASAREIDRQVREAGARGESTFHLDEQALRARLGRPLSDEERRALWAALWREAVRPP